MEEKNKILLKRLLIAVLIIVIISIVATIGIGNYFVNYAILRTGNGGDREVKNADSITVANIDNEAEKIIEENKKNVAKVVEGKVDECSIAAYLYEVSDYSETLDGTNINTSEKVILRAALADGTAKNDYVEVTVPFEEIGNGSYDASKKYKLAIVCTPSKWGDQFMGADLSSLYVKYLAVE